MVKLSSAIVEAIVEEYGAYEVLARLADPFWFQALSCVVGFDWHSSIRATVVRGKTTINKILRKYIAFINKIIGIIKYKNTGGKTWIQKRI
ncbi:MAG: DUF763 domain-containing protein, partial [Peptococcaceae bacterium]|nr:DUF763 domain-containing protein [Peptococcaceae bacterium]